MDHFDDIVIGSGLAALGVVLGLTERRKILVLGGEKQGQFTHYDHKGAVPSSFSGLGGLGGFWHGVIPMSYRSGYSDVNEQVFRQLFARFYPAGSIDRWFGQDKLFVPWSPIRPAVELAKLASQEPSSLKIVEEVATTILNDGVNGRVKTKSREYRAKRIWVAAGALGTPKLLANSFGSNVCSTHISDHVLCYIGYVDKVPAPSISRTGSGIYFGAYRNPENTALYTLRPARFGFRKLDYGIEQRAAFGLPTGGAISKIMRSMSPGLLSEAFYNRFGLFASADRYSIYAQIRVGEAYKPSEDKQELHPELPKISAAANLAREMQPFSGAVLSNRPDLYIPGIHLHDSLDMPELERVGVNQPTSAIQIVDAAQIHDIGAEHHSFRMLCAGYRRAQQAI